MKTTAQAEASFSHLLFRWLAYHATQAMAAIRPAHRASDISAAVAASGNPSGV